MKRPNQRLRATRQSFSGGVTLIEVLVAVIVLSIGLLGIAGLQAATVKYKINSWARSANAVLLSDLTDRIRMNTDVAGPNFERAAATQAYVLDKTWATQQSEALSLVREDQLNPACNSGSTICSDVQRAAFDILAWRKKVNTSLPQGGAFIEGDKGLGFVVTLMWFDKEYTDKRRTTDDGASGNSVNLVSAQTCTASGTESGLAAQTCCPDAAKVPAGVRCARYGFTP